jgi:hypothetical protein
MTTLFINPSGSRGGYAGICSQVPDLGRPHNPWRLVILRRLTATIHSGQARVASDCDHRASGSLGSRFALTSGYAQ